MHFVFLTVIVLLRLMHTRRPHADLLAIGLNLTLTVGLEQRLHAAELLFLGFLLFHEFNFQL